MANHDGTHLYALDAATGKLRWHNGDSGSLQPDTGAGVSVNGHLLLHQGRLHLAGGNMVPVASYDLPDGHCVSTPTPPASHTIFRAGSDLFAAGNEVLSAGFPLYSSRGDYRLAGPWVLPMPRGKLVATLGPHDSKITLEPVKAAAGEATRGWSQRCVSRLYGLALTREALVVAGAHDPESAGKPLTASISALSAESGSVLWKHALPAPPVPWGVAIDRAGRALVTLQDGRVLAYGDQ
jgi:hypothetical protein